MITKSLRVLLAFLVLVMAMLACDTQNNAQSHAEASEEMLAGLPVPPVGDVWLASQGTTTYWVNQAFNGANFTQILTNGQGSYFIMWNPSGANGVGFTLVNEAGANGSVVIDWMKATGGKGNLVNFKDANGVITYMKDQGWKAIPAAEVPAALKATWSTFAQSIAQGLLNFGSSLISIIIVPINVIPDELLVPANDAIIT